MLSLGFTEIRGWTAPLEAVRSEPPAQAGPPRAGCAGPSPDGFCPSPRTPQPPWAAWANAWLSSQQKTFSDVQRQPPVQPLVMSMQWDKSLLSTAETSLKIKARFAQYLHTLKNGSLTALLLLQFVFQTLFGFSVMHKSLLLYFQYCKAKCREGAVFSYRFVQ